MSACFSADAFVGIGHWTVATLFSKKCRIPDRSVFTARFYSCRDTTGGPTEMPTRVNGFFPEDDQSAAFFFRGEDVE